MTHVTVNINSGTVRGLHKDGVNVFYGIPYGEPTGGERRFQAPQPRNPWDGVLDATEWGPACPQPSLAAVHDSDVSGDALDWDNTSEDCLLLHVHSPASPTDDLRPVLVLLHSGAFSAGSASSIRHEGSNLARRGDIVTVSVNHRVGAFGYLHLADIAGQEWADAGNAGQLDLVLALTWIRDNIAAFGGDPDRITISGESGGGAKVCTLLAMPAAAGLFHRAIMESAMPLAVHSRASGSRVAELILKQLGLSPTGIDELKRLPVERIIEAQRAVQESLARGPHGSFREWSSSTWVFMPTVDGDHLPDTPWDSFAGGRSASIPLIVGGVREEAFATIDVDDEEELRSEVTELFGETAIRLIEVYSADAPHKSHREVLTAILNDANGRILYTRLIEHRLSRGEAPTWMYQFEWDDYAEPWVRLGANHGATAPLIWQNIDYVPALARSRSARVLADSMSDSWVAFVRTGDPNTPRLPPWSPYSLPERNVMVFDEAPIAVADFRGASRKAWCGIDLVEDVTRRG